jgi:hypothetical protein
MELTDAPAWIDNWARLGLVVVRWDAQKSPSDQYAWVENRPEVKRLRAQHDSDTEHVAFDHGIIVLTDFGNRFAGAVGITGPDRSPFIAAAHPEVEPADG